MARVAAFLIIVVLVAGMVDCAGGNGNGESYTLTVDFTTGGTVVVDDVSLPGKSILTYDAGTVVYIVAVPEEGYKFLNWTGDVEAVADVAAPSTTITMEGDRAITGNFTLEYIYFDEIGPGPWSVGTSGQGANPTVTEEGIVVNYDSNPRGGIGMGFGGGATSEFTLKGDFDIRMGYELITWPNSNGVRVAMSVLMDVSHGWPDEFVNIERISPGPDESWLGNEEVYLVNCDHSIHGITGTSDLSGTLRICRQGLTVSCYYHTSDDWYKLFEGVWFGEDVYIQVHTFSDEANFCGKEVSVLLRTVEIVEPPL